MIVKNQISRKLNKTERLSKYSIVRLNNIYCCIHFSVRLMPSILSIGGLGAI